MNATKFLAYLESIEIEGEIQQEGELSAVWIYDEVKYSHARTAWELFCRNPNIAVPKKPFPYSNAKESKKSPTNLPNKSRFRSTSDGLVTIAFILLSVGATMIAQTPSLNHLTSHLYFSQFIGSGAPEIREGEYWRLITPIFLHGNWLHLIFNMMWVMQLGTQIERAKGSLFFIFYTFFVATLCHICQFLISGPLFVGFSGVVYSYLGYIWLMNKYRPNPEFSLSSDTITFMVIWLFLCLAGILPNVANAEHVSGLVIGMIWGYVQSKGYKADWRRWNFRRKL